MKRKMAIAATFLFFLVQGSLQLTAQTKKKGSLKKENQVEQVSITSSKDSLSYAYGVNLTGEGLKDYLTQIGIAGDTEKVNSFLKGLNESLSTKGENSPYFTGLGVGDQIYKMTVGFSEQNFADKSVDNLDFNIVAKAISDALTSKPVIAQDSAAIIIEKVKFMAGVRNKELKKQEYTSQIQEGNKFLEENKTKDGVITLPSGLQYKVLVKGDGSIPKEKDVVKVHYKGSLLDGTEFDSSYKRGEPMAFGVNQVIQGWSQALTQMPVGSKWIIYLPYDLAYGENGAGKSIPPFSTLIFEIELISIEKPDPY